MSGGYIPISGPIFTYHLSARAMAGSEDDSFDDISGIEDFGGMLMPLGDDDQSLTITDGDTGQSAPLSEAATSETQGSPAKEEQLVTISETSDKMPPLPLTYGPAMRPTGRSSSPSPMARPTQIGERGRAESSKVDELRMMMKKEDHWWRKEAPQTRTQSALPPKPKMLPLAEGPHVDLKHELEKIIKEETPTSSSGSSWSRVSMPRTSWPHSGSESGGAGPPCAAGGGSPSWPSSTPSDPMSPRPDASTLPETNITDDMLNSISLRKLLDEARQSNQQESAGPPPTDTRQRMDGLPEETGAGPPCAGNLGATYPTQEVGSELHQANEQMPMDLSEGSGTGPPCAGDRRTTQNLQQNVLLGVHPEKYAHDMARAAAEVDRVRTAAKDYVRWTQSEVASLVQQASQKYNLDMDAAAQAVLEANKRAESAVAEAGNTAEYAKAVAEHAYTCALKSMKMTVDQVRHEARQHCEQAKVEMQANEAKLAVAIRDADENAKGIVATNQMEMNRMVTEHREKARRATEAKEEQEQ